MIVGRIVRVGDGVAVTLPKAEVDALALKEGDLVSVEIRKLGGPHVMSPKPPVRSALGEGTVPPA